jgi:hypothetical protein
VAVVGPALLATGGWRGASIVFGIPAIVVAIAILLFVRELGTDRAAARASGSVRHALGSSDRRPRPAVAVPDVGPRRWRRGLGVVNLFVLST